MSNRYLGMTTTYSLFELMDYGSIVAKCEDMQIILTINGAYYNGFMYVGEGQWISINDVWAPAWSQDEKSRGLYSDSNSVRLINIQTEAEAILEEIRTIRDKELEDEDIDYVAEKNMKEVVKE